MQALVDILRAVRLRVDWRGARVYFLLLRVLAEDGDVSFAAQLHQVLLTVVMVVMVTCRRRPRWTRAVRAAHLVLVEAVLLPLAATALALTVITSQL